ncbi:MAG TPA: TIGR03086 family metal-binding protein [Streptosporangiaceae bacterium]|nr:TIGR03086 family metal-binding protein [Streptosporangiaceae bacterium]
MLDLEPATRTLAGLVDGIRSDQLTAPTPCRDATVGDLLDHVDGLSMAFTAAATKTPLDGGSRGPSADASRLGPDWRTRIPRRLASLAGAWCDAAAWTGMTHAGGVDLPGEVAGVVALDEVIVHGWDIAVGSGQSFTCEPRLAQAAYEFVRASVAQNPHGTPGLFGPPVPVPDDAPLFDRLIGLTGRDPAWRAAVKHA